MSDDGKKNLTEAEDRQDSIWRKLKDLAANNGHGRLKCEIVIRDGPIQEIRHQPFEGVI